MRGFTLLELMFVVVLQGILATTMLPRYTTVIEQARSAEALAQLSAVRTSLHRYAAEHGTSLGATLSNLDIEDPNNRSLYPRALFSYSLAHGGPSTFAVTASRNSDPTKTITLHQDGRLVKRGY